jgi:NAD+-dependent protein deacetylase sirtuin 6
MTSHCHIVNIAPRPAVCRGRLRDFILDWEDALPDEQLEAAEQHADQADLMLCLGTSLQIRPICQLPLRTQRHGGQFCLVNLQKTPKNQRAQLVIHARCDEVMEKVMAHLQRPIPTFVRRDFFMLRAWLTDSQDDDEV